MNSRVGLGILLILAVVVVIFFFLQPQPATAPGDGTLTNVAQQPTDDPADPTAVEPNPTALEPNPTALDANPTALESNPTAVPSATRTSAPTATASLTPTLSPTPRPSQTPSRTPTATPDTQIVIAQIEASADDVNQDGPDAANVDVDDPLLWIGTGEVPEASFTGLRFRLPVPQGVTIVAARLEFYIVGEDDQWIAINVNIAAVDADSSPRLNATNSRPSQQVLAVPGLTHTSNEQWEAGGWVAFEELTPILQPLVNRAGWEAGNTITLIVQGATEASWGRKFFASYDEDPSRAPRLVVEYVP
jgi:hypothetical protein